MIEKIRWLTHDINNTQYEYHGCFKIIYKSDTDEIN